LSNPNIDTLMTVVALVIALAALLFSIVDVLRSLNTRRARQQQIANALGSSDSAMRYRQTRLLPDVDVVVEIERASPNGSTEVFQLRPDDEQSIRSFLRKANTLKHESAHASVR
jgi:hypothetical protein